MKLQPNFSWQKYEGQAEDQKEQFQYQLQSQHIQVSNSVNATIDDISFWTRERGTAETWVDGKQIFTKSVATVAWPPGGLINTIPLGIVGNFTVIDIVCCLSDGTLAASNTVLLPHLDVSNPLNNISIVRNGTSIVITSGGTDFSAFSGFVTVLYVKN